MAIPTGYPEGSKLRIYQSADGVSSGATLVGGMNSYEKKSDRSSDSTATFDDAVAPSTPGARTQSFSISGLYKPSDTGQNALRTAESSDTAVWLHIYPDGVSGFKQQVKIGSFSHRATPTGFQEYGFDASALGSAASDTGVAGAGTGYIV